MLVYFFFIMAAKVGEIIQKMDGRKDFLWASNCISIKLYWRRTLVRFVLWATGEASTI
jgi:hypothetical protein